MAYQISGLDSRRELHPGIEIYTIRTARLKHGWQSFRSQPPGQKPGPGKDEIGKPGSIQGPAVTSSLLSAVQNKDGAGRGEAVQVLLHSPSMGVPLRPEDFHYPFRSDLEAHFGLLAAVELGKVQVCLLHAGQDIVWSLADKDTHPFGPHSGNGGYLPGVHRAGAGGMEDKPRHINPQFSAGSDILPAG